MAVKGFATKRIQGAYERGPVSRFGSQVAWDSLSWTVALIGASLFRYDFDVQQVHWGALAVLCLATAAVQTFAGWSMYLYRGRHPFGSFAEVRALFSAALITAAVIGIPVILFGTIIGVPRSAVLIGAPIALLLMGLGRYVKRAVIEQAHRPGENAEVTLVYGAGFLGESIVKRMITDSRSRYLPVGLLDDDPMKRPVWLHGIPVMGSGADLTRVARETGATVVVVAIGYADAPLLRRISDQADEAGVQVKVLPLLEDILEGRARLKDLRNLSIEDLIGRHPVDTAVESVAGYLQGKRVLVTGAGGSIGAELCRQIAKFQPAELMMLDRDETSLQEVQLSIHGHGLLDTKDVVLADIRDASALACIFAERQPQVVFHAAALKHLPMLEQYPDEAWKTNVLGTANVLQAARSAGVDTFVNISTDKAANPTSVLGHSKRVAEKLTAWAAEETGLRYLSVRFGNVIGSRGSMLPTFTSLIEAGGPVTVTHPDVTRFFMTIPEACQLVLQAGGIGQGAEVLILDMGEPVRILDVAKRMIEMSGKDVEIIFTGLRPGEKLHEELIGRNELDERPLHPKISHARVDVLAPGNLDQHRWRERCRLESDGRAALGAGVSA